MNFAYIYKLRYKLVPYKLKAITQRLGVPLETSGILEILLIYRAGAAENASDMRLPFMLFLVARADLLYFNRLLNQSTRHVEARISTTRPDYPDKLRIWFWDGTNIQKMQELISIFRPKKTIRSKRKLNFERNFQ